MKQIYGLFDDETNMIYFNRVNIFVVHLHTKSTSNSKFTSHLMDVQYHLTQSKFCFFGWLSEPACEPHSCPTCTASSSSGGQPGVRAEQQNKILSIPKYFYQPKDI